MPFPKQDCSSAISWRFLLPALIVPFIGSLFYFVWFSDTSIGKITYGCTKAFTLFYPLLIVFFFRRGRPSTINRAPGAPPPQHRKSVGFGLLTGMIIGGTIFGLFYSPWGEIVRESAPNIAKKATALGFAEHYVLFAAFVSILHSALEEYYWRWFAFSNLQQLLIKAPRWSPHIIAAGAFAAHHLVVTWQFFPPWFAIIATTGVATGGLIWSILLTRYRSLLGPWISHLLVDIALMAIGHTLIFGIE